MKYGKTLFHYDIILQGDYMNIYDIIKENKLDAVLVSSSTSIRYLTNFTGTEALVLITNSMKYIFVDSRYFEQAKQQCLGFNIILHSRLDLYIKINQLIRENMLMTIGFEKDRVFVSDYENYARSLNCSLKGISLNKVRTRKNSEEIKNIKKACEITDKAYSHILDFIKIGMSEKEVAIELQKYVLENGATGFSFETIVASGKRGSMPHGVASEKIIEANDFITLDFGVVYNGYCSDMTRTFVIGDRPSEQLVKIYNIVREAQQKAIEIIKPGIKANVVDKVVRDYINEKGYGDYFNHGTGHGIGLEIHESPFINPSNDEILEVGNVLTIEPGIYIPDLGGVRIEDDIIVTETGYDIINKSSKELIMIKGR